MCELLAMSCRYPARLTYSLAALAARARLPSRNQDGWGLACYQGRDVALFRDAACADGHPLVTWLMRHGPATDTAIGYIRHSTQGDITLANTGPFTRELNGRVHTFVHNGNLHGSGGPRAHGSRRFQPLGETDSELAFCDLLENVAHLNRRGAGIPSLDARIAVVAKAARAFRSRGPSNFIYGDGDALFVHADQRYQGASGVIAPPALHYFECSAHQVEGLVRGVDSPRTGQDQRVVLVATVPISEHPWERIERGQLLALRDGAIVARASL